MRYLVICASMLISLSLLAQPFDAKTYQPTYLPKGCIKKLESDYYWMFKVGIETSSLLKVDYDLVSHVKEVVLLNQRSNLLHNKINNLQLIDEKNKKIISEQVKRIETIEKQRDDYLKKYLEEKNKPRIELGNDTHLIIEAVLIMVLGGFVYKECCI